MLSREAILLHRRAGACRRAPPLNIRSRRRKVQEGGQPLSRSRPRLAGAYLLALPYPGMLRSMIVGLGLDLVSTARFERFIARRGERGLRRVFTAAELDYCRSLPAPAASLAAR